MTLKEQNDFYRKAGLGRKDGKDMSQAEINKLDKKVLKSLERAGKEKKTSKKGKK